jgi:hypothetical protein
MRSERCLRTTRILPHAGGRSNRRFRESLATGERISRSRAAKGERGIWQRRYREPTLRDENDFARHIDYIHIHPVKHELVPRVRDWPYSSFHRRVKLGVYPEDWAGDVSHDGASFGERRQVARPGDGLRKSSAHPTG